MLFIIAIQGTYLGYTVGILTNLEKRFSIPSKKSGLLLSIYDIGHTLAVMIIGFMAMSKNQARITAFGVLFSALSMFLLILPAFIFGPVANDQKSLIQDKQVYILNNVCDPSRSFSGLIELCEEEKKEHLEAYLVLAVGQLLAGIAAAPFNTVAYVYIDDNLFDKTMSPFYLGLLSSMYAFGPAFGFALSAGVTRLYATVFEAPANLNIYDDEWIGAWWLGFLVCGVLYLFGAIPIFFFPKSFDNLYGKTDPIELNHLRSKEFDDQDAHENENLREIDRNSEKTDFIRPQNLLQFYLHFCSMTIELLRNPVFLSMVIGWMFGSYLTGGYTTYLPKYIETQFAQSSSAADMYAGLISIGSIAASTALGGYLLTKFDLKASKAILCLLASWSIIFATYLFGMTIGCNEPELKDLVLANRRYEFRDISECNFECHCYNVHHFNPVHYGNLNFFSPCHAGCRIFNDDLKRWDQCSCAFDEAVENGLYLEKCEQIFIYIIVVFIGMFFGNLFFMTTIMIILRSVFDYQKVMALSIASCFTNLLGFIPAPIIFGYILDSTCMLWHSRCPDDYGNCVVYDNKLFRQNFHLSSASSQALAVISIFVCYLFSRKHTFFDNMAVCDSMDSTPSNTPTLSIKEIKYQTSLDVNLPSPITAEV
ncbi:unnamed protein product [Dracunculus medinensis]|uniref:Solute carrier organic anion transporter family member n=1 Tax=Dracunculus medinensis TaxID=318479 RepID=A0A0N4UDI2_DRAME|nr:unnamed protein product [Dracunculus medinensis]